jgi:two-component system cell cycle response regulator
MGKIESASFELPDNQGSIKVTASIGVSVYTDSVTDIEQALKNADDALYRAKENGRNQVACA